MMKRLLVLTVITTVLASSAYGASIIRLDPLITGSTGTAGYVVSEDGRYVGGRVTDTDTFYSPGYYDTSVGSGNAGWTVIPPTGGQPVTGTGVVIGVAHNSLSTQIVAAVNQNDNNSRTAYSTASQYGKQYTSGDTTTRVMTPASNTMLGSSTDSSSSGQSGHGSCSFFDGTDAWLAASHSQGGNSKGNDAYVYKGSGNGAIWSTLASGRNNSKFTVNGVAGNGRVVGWDSPAAGKQGSWYDGSPAGGIASTAIQNIPHIPNWTQRGSWYAYGISNSGQYAVGYQYMTGSVTRPQAFLADLNAGTAIDLLPENGVPSQTHQGVAFDAADDGFAVGYEYNGAGIYPSGTYEAVAWVPWDPTHHAISLRGLAIGMGIDVSAWAHLGTGAGSVTKVGNQYYIVGTGLFNGDGVNLPGTRAFLLIIPEPATLTFLALGGLAMLRRRR